MNVQIEIWQLITFMIGLLITFFSAVFIAAKVLFRQFETRITERLTNQDGMLSKLSKDSTSAANAVSQECMRIEREFLQFKADLPRDYVRREDSIRAQSTIEAKLDALYRVVIDGGRRKNDG